MKKGIVVESAEKFAVVMAPDGAFHKVNVKKARIGEELRYGTPPMRLAALAACFMLLFGGGAAGVSAYVVQNQPAVYAMIDINPAVEFTIARNGKIKSGRPLNKSGELVLSDDPNLKFGYGNAVRQYVDTVVNLGYFRYGAAVGDPAVLITVASDDSKLAQKVRAGLYCSIAEHLARYRINSYILTDVVSKNDAEVCRQFGISPGKLHLLRSLGLTMEEGCAKSIRELNDLLKSRHEAEHKASLEELTELNEVRIKLMGMYQLSPATETEQQAFLSQFERWCQTDAFREKIMELRENWDSIHTAWEKRVEQLLSSCGAAA